MADEATSQEQNDQTPADALPESQVTIDDLEHSRKKITIEVDRRRIDAKAEEIFGELKNTAPVPGFRVGHAPRRLLEKRFGKEVSEDVRNAVVGEALGKIVDREDLDVLGEPELDLDSIELPAEGNLVFSFEVEIKPQFELPDYDGIAVEEPSAEVTDEHLHKATKAMLSHRGTLAPIDGPAEMEDEIVADLTITGEGIDEKRENMEMVVAPGAPAGIPLEDLGEKLTGAKVGDTVEFESKVPDAHEKEEWRDKDVKVTLEIKEVKRLEVPEITDELAGEYGMDSADAMREAIQSSLANRLEAERQDAMRQQVCEYLLNNTEMDLPEGATRRQTAQILRRRYVDLLYRGVPREMIEQNLELLEARAGEQAAGELKLSFILEKIAEAEGVSVDEGEVNMRIAQMAMQQGRRPERLRSEMSADGSLEAVSSQIREQKTIDKLLEKANVTPKA